MPNQTPWISVGNAGEEGVPNQTPWISVGNSVDGSQSNTLDFCR